MYKFHGQEHKRANKREESIARGNILSLTGISLGKKLVEHMNHGQKKSPPPPCGK